MKRSLKTAIECVDYNLKNGTIDRPQAKTLLEKIQEVYNVSWNEIIAIVNFYS